MRILKQDPKTESSLQKKIILFVILFFAIAFYCNGQIHSYHRYNDSPIVTKVPDIALGFHKGKDTIYISIMADSINPLLYETSLYAYLPKSMKVNDITIGFEGDISQKFNVSYIDSVSYSKNYVEYHGTAMAYYVICNIKYKYINFEGSKIHLPPLNRETYFIDFGKLAYSK